MSRRDMGLQAPGGVAYDAPGYITNDGHVSYLYNANVQICAIQITCNNMTLLTGYIYNAPGPPRTGLSPWGGQTRTARPRVQSPR